MDYSKSSSKIQFFLEYASIQGMKSVSLLGVTVHSLSVQEALQQLHAFLDSDRPRVVVTPNPEILLRAYHDAVYQDALNRADLSLPDGSGLKFVSSIPETVHGVDMARALLEIASTKQLRVACVVRSDGRSLPEQIKKTVQDIAPSAEIEVVSLEKQEWENTDVLQPLQQFQPQIVLVGLGFPEQEFWLDRHLKHISSARVGMAIGGAFDFWTGVAKRAPRGMQRLHLEWLWRVIHEPRRIGRILRAVIVFPVTVLFSKMKK